VTRAIRKHLPDFLAIIALFILAIATAAYILSQERLRFPLIQKSAFMIKAELPDAQAVTPGQGQSVRVAGVEVGQIGKVDLAEGHANVELQLEPKYKGLIRQDASALLRTKTGLKDMFIEVDPGDGKPLKSGGHIQLSNTAPDIDPDEILAALDADTRDYLKLLISGAGKGLKGRGTDLRETFARFGPLHRDLAKVSTAVARRRANLRRLVHNYGLLVQELGGKDKDLTRLVQQSNAVFSAFASEDQNVSAFVQKLPGTLRQTQSTLVKVDRLGHVLGPSLESLRPAFRRLDTANKAVLPLAREGAPILKNEVRPFARSSQSFTRDFGVAARNLSKAGPDLTASFHQLNRLFNMAAYNPKGSESISSGCETNGTCTDAERNRNEGYLYWLAWITQNTTSIFSTRDGQSDFRRVTLGGVDCNIVAQIAGGITGQIPAETVGPLNGALAQLPTSVKDTVDGVIGQPAGSDPTVSNVTDFGKVLGALGLCSQTGP
jgi:phospholipid/cholesterol/gamma-HCH transport system substrate-binding protein